MAALSDAAERLFWRLTVAVDDYGRFEAEPDVILGTCVPRLKWSQKKVIGCLMELGTQISVDDQPLAIYYRVKGRLYGELVTFLDHQRKRDSKPKFPGAEDGERVQFGGLAATCGSLRQLAALSVSESVSVSENENESREPRAGGGGAGPRTAAESMAELERFVISPETRTWAEKEGIPNPEDYLEEFRDYWRSVGAKRSNGQVIRDWDATFRNRLRDLKAQGKLKKRSVWSS